MSLDNMQMITIYSLFLFEYKYKNLVCLPKNYISRLQSAADFIV